MGYFQKYLIKNLKTQIYSQCRDEFANSINIDFFYTSKKRLADFMENIFKFIKRLTDIQSFRSESIVIYEDITDTLTELEKLCLIIFKDIKGLKGNLVA